jgi:zinc transport system permease protein
MIEFWNAILSALDSPYAFLWYAALGGCLGSVALGVVGTYVVTRRITGIAGAVAHCVLGGIGFALYAERVWGWAWLSPVAGAFISALMSAFLIGIIGRNSSEREDTLIGALWAIGMALGLVFLAKTPGFVDPMVYLFGNILLLSADDLQVMACLDLGILAIIFAFYHPLLAICFDEEAAALRGLPVRGLYGLLLVITALTIVLMIRVVGTVLVIALLTLPAATAGQLVHRLWQMMVLGSLISIACVLLGLSLSYFWDLPPGPMIGLTAAMVYLMAIVAKKLFRAA